MHRTCPAWVGYILLNPLRRLFENPRRMLARYVLEGMTVMEPGCGMGYFTLPLAEMVGPKGRVIALDIQAKMLSAVQKRAERAGLAPRIEVHHCGAKSLDLGDLSQAVDLVTAIHMVHEVRNQRRFFEELWHSLKPAGRLLLIEPRFHVSRDAFEGSLSLAGSAGFQREEYFQTLGGRFVLLSRGTGKDD